MSLVTIFAMSMSILKPIFHQNAKYLASGTFASLNAKNSIFASPNAKNTNMLVSFALGDANFLCWPCTFHFLCVYFFALGSKRKPHFQWNIGCVGSLAQHFCVGHVHFMLFIPFFSALGTQRECCSQWNMGLRNALCQAVYFYPHVTRLYVACRFTKWPCHRVEFKGQDPPVEDGVVGFVTPLDDVAELQGVLRTQYAPRPLCHNVCWKFKGTSNYQADFQNPLKITLKFPEFSLSYKGYNARNKYDSTV